MLRFRICSLNEYMPVDSEIVKGIDYRYYVRQRARHSIAEDFWNTNMSPGEPIQREQIERVGRAAYGERWTSALAKDLGVTSQYLGAVMAGKFPVSRSLVVRLVAWVKDEGLRKMKQRELAMRAAAAALGAISAESEPDPDEDFEEDNDGPEFR